MRAAYINEPGPVENIAVGELPDPKPGPGQVLVRVTYAAVNPIDTYVRSGAVAMELPSPYVVGCDLAGVVEEAGAGVDDLPPGTRVWGSNQGLLGRQGTFSELVAVDRHWLYQIPNGVSDEQAAATALVGITAALGLFEEAKLQPGERLVVHGGGGAVGSTVIQMAVAHGAKVLAVTGGPEKCAACEALGAEVTVDYLHEDANHVAASIAAWAAEGVNVWWETSRTPQLELAIGALARRGRMIVMAGRDARPELPIGPFYAKCCRLLGFVMFLCEPEVQVRAAAKVNELLAAGKLQTPVAKVASLDETAALHDLQHNSTVLGKQPLRGKLLVKF
ncbi:MAG: quinone oxidoreductase [Planctomycetaceae bacterium]|nr:quinone oxidoreductase [Planctomycetaceae bacterium]